MATQALPPDPPRVAYLLTTKIKSEAVTELLSYASRDTFQFDYLVKYLAKAGGAVHQISEGNAKTLMHHNGPLPNQGLIVAIQHTGLVVTSIITLQVGSNGWPAIHTLEYGSGHTTQEFLHYVTSRLIFTVSFHKLVKAIDHEDVVAYAFTTEMFEHIFQNVESAPVNQPDANTLGNGSMKYAILFKYGSRDAGVYFMGPGADSSGVVAHPKFKGAPSKDLMPGERILEVYGDYLYKVNARYPLLKHAVHEAFQWEINLAIPEQHRLGQYYNRIIPKQTYAGLDLHHQLDLHDHNLHAFLALPSCKNWKSKQTLGGWRKDRGRKQS